MGGRTGRKRGAGRAAPEDLAAVAVAVAAIAALAALAALAGPDAFEEVDASAPGRIRRLPR